MRCPRLWIPAIVILPVAVIIIVWISFSPGQWESLLLSLSREMEGSPPPVFHISSPEGEVLLFTEVREGPYLAVFWSPGCSYCHRMLAFMAEWERRNDRALPLILVSFVGDDSLNRTHLPESPGAWGSYSFSESSGESDALRKSPSLQIIPTAWAVGEDGIIIRELHGFNILAVNRMLKRLSGIRKSQFWFLVWMADRPE